MLRPKLGHMIVSLISYYGIWLTDLQATGLHVQCNDTSNIQVHVTTLKVLQCTV